MKEVKLRIGAMCDPDLKSKQYMYDIAKRATREREQLADPTLGLTQEGAAASGPAAADAPILS
jgi:hypothetical protein